MARGYRDYDLHVRVAAVICNNVASPRHADWTREAVEGIGLPVLGCLPRSQGFAVPERHLGLFTAAECPHELRDLLTRLGGVVRQEINLERVWQIARTAMTFPVTLAEAPPCRPRVRLAVARDEAFCFYYDDNLDLLRQAGAEIAFFSPLRDARLPEGSAGIYLGGGYPELYAASLAANLPLLQDLRRARQAGFPIYAECGGLMYLTQGILDREGRMHRLVGLLPGYCRLSERPTIGYRTARALRHSLLLLAGETVRGHEFHYSEWLGLPADPLSAYALEDAQASASRAEGWAEEGLLASYVHLHFAAHPALAGRFVAACCSVADRRQPANP
jgi:cobyrinic acid a,c-diamide synthase